VTAFAARPETAILVQIDDKKSENWHKTTQKQLVCGEPGPIVTLWQQWGENIPFTSTFTLRNAYFRGRTPARKADSGLAIPEHRTPKPALGPDPGWNPFLGQTDAQKR
jgi:hypothetical protein